MKLNKKRKTLLISFLMTTIMILSIANQVLAAGVSIVNPNNTATGPFNKAMNVTIGVFQVVAVGVGVVMLIALAVKYMSAAPGEKAEIKKHAVVYIVGAIIAFSATGVAQLLKQFTSDAGSQI